MEITDTMKELLAQLHTQSINRKNTDTNHVNTRFPLTMIQEIDEAADKFKVTRTDVIKNAVSLYLQTLKNNLY